MDNLLEDADLPSVDENKNYYDELVGEGKKFKTNEDLAKSKYLADNYIEILKKRSDTLREDYLSLRNELNTRARLEDIVNQLQSKKTDTEGDLTHKPDEYKAPKLEEIESLIDTRVDTRISQREKTRRESENYNLVQNKLKERYGENYQSFLKNQIEQLGMTSDELNDFARKHPNVLIKTLGLDQVKTENFQAPPTSQSRTPFKPTSERKRTWSYYQELRKKDPNAWLDPKISIQMHNDALTLGDAFKDGDYDAV